MDKKSVAASILVVVLAIVFAIIGSCFATFVFQYTKIEISSIAVSAASGIEVFEDEKMTKKVTNLKLSEQLLGIKPATGELDAETQIPTTVSSENTTEGYYSSIWVKSEINYKIVISNIKVKTEQNQLEAEAERKNIFVAIEDIANSTKSLEDDNIQLVIMEDNEEPQKLTFLFWLSGLAGESLEGAKISFTLEFLAI